MQQNDIEIAQNDLPSPREPRGAYLTSPSHQGATRTYQTPFLETVKRGIFIFAFSDSRCHKTWKYMFPDFFSRLFHKLVIKNVQNVLSRGNPLGSLVPEAEYSQKLQKKNLFSHSNSLIIV